MILQVTYENVKDHKGGYVWFFFHTLSHTDLIDFFQKLQFYECSKIWNTNVSGVYNMLIW